MVRFQVRTPAREALVDVTSQVAEALAETGMEEGALLVYVPHTTAGILVNENADPDVGRDISEFLSELAPRDRAWRHGEGNADAHVKASMVGESVLLPVSGGRLALGRWQGVFLAEFDGPRTRELWVVPLVSGSRRG